MRGACEHETADVQWATPDVLGGFESSVNKVSPLDTTGGT